MQFPVISVYSFSDKGRCGDERKRHRCWRERESLIEALAAFSGVPFYLMRPISPALHGLPSPLITCVLSAEAGVVLRSGGVLSRRANNLTPDYRHTINYY